VGAAAQERQSAAARVTACGKAKIDLSLMAFSFVHSVQREPADLLDGKLAEHS